MIDMSKLLGVAAALVLAAGLSVGDARAITVVDDGDTVDVGPGLETAFVGDIKGRPSGGPSAWEVQFDSTTPASASALVTLSSVVASTFTDLVMSWINAADSSVIASVPISPVETTLGTLFTSPGALSQILAISWSSSSTDPRVGFDVTVEVSPVPLPAGVLLLMTAVGGLGVMRARRRNVTV
jgi:hypothetical protein